MNMYKAGPFRLGLPVSCGAGTMLTVVTLALLQKVHRWVSNTG